MEDVKESAKTEIDLSFVVIGTKVAHKKFGEGVISNFDKSRKYIKVSFSAGEKTFVFPSCFEQGFLTLLK